VITLNEPVDRLDYLTVYGFFDKNSDGGRRHNPDVDMRVNYGVR